MARRHSYSSLQTLMKCERQYALRFIEELEKDAPEKLIYMRGHAWHALLAADAMQRGAALGSLRNFPDKLEVLHGLNLGIDWNPISDDFQQRVNPTILAPDGGPEIPLTPWSVIEHVAAWENTQESERKEEIVAKFGAPLHERLRDLWVRYQLKWGEREAQFLPILVEYEWSREAPNGMLLQGRLDSVVFDRENHLTIVRDAKTHDSWPSEPDAVLDLMNSQLHLQAWGVAPALRELTGDWEAGPTVPQAVEFDRVRFKKPTEPKLTTKGILSKAVTDFDGYTYKEWCLSQGTSEHSDYEFEQEVYDKAEANPDAWFQRSMKPLSMRAVEAHVKAAQAQALRAEKVVSSEAGIVPSSDCAWCEFLPLCRAEIIGGRPDTFIPADFGLRKKKSV